MNSKVKMLISYKNCMKQESTITIVTVCFNCVAIIEKTIISVLKIKDDRCEYIVIDGQSKDGTLDVIKQHENDIDIIISEPDSGIYDAMNKGLKMAHGDWIFFLNAGDELSYDFSIDSFPFNYYKDDETIAGIYGNYQMLKKGRIINVISSSPFFNKTKYQKIFNPSMGFHHQSVFMRTRLAQKILFDIDYKLCADFNMIYKLYLEGYHYVYVNAFVSIIEGSDGASYLNPILQRKEHYRLLGLDGNLLAYLILKYKTLKRKIKQLV